MGWSSGPYSACARMCRGLFDLFLEVLSYLLCLPAMGIQKQIDNLKDKLQETQDRRKRQEDLIMKVENLALKVNSASPPLL